MKNMSLKSLAEDYFKNLNSISARIHNDLEEVKSSYEELWTTIPEKEQQTILTDSIIKPEISIKYNSAQEKIKNQYAVKMIFDENCSYRDEHSAPFSFKSQSQRDLSIFSPQKENTSSAKKTKLPLKSSTTKSKPTLLYTELENEHTSDVLPSETTSSLPKTGLDFLDNW